MLTFEARRFVWGGTPQIVALLILAVLAVVLVRCGRRWRGKPAQKQFSRAFALAILLTQGPMQLDTMLPKNWAIRSSLPLQLCDLAWMIAIYALWTRRQWAATLLYYWGLTLTAQAMITPDLDWDFPAREFIMFYYGHGVVVLAAIYLTWGVGLTPHWRDYRRTLAVTLLWGASVFAFNGLAGTNYGYLNRKPPVASALDFLGPYPVYLASELLLASAGWALMTWAWTRRRRQPDAAEQSPVETRPLATAAR